MAPRVLLESFVDVFVHDHYEGFAATLLHPGDQGNASSEKTSEQKEDEAALLLQLRHAEHMYEWALQAPLGAEGLRICNVTERLAQVEAKLAAAKVGIEWVASIRLSDPLGLILDANGAIKGIEPGSQAAKAPVLVEAGVGNGGWKLLEVQTHKKFTAETAAELLDEFKVYKMLIQQRLYYWPQEGTHSLASKQKNSQKLPATAIASHLNVNISYRNDSATTMFMLSSPVARASFSRCLPLLLNTGGPEPRHRRGHSDPRPRGSIARRPRGSRAHQIGGLRAAPRSFPLCARPGAVWCLSSSLQPLIVLF